MSISTWATRPRSYVPIARPCTSTTARLTQPRATRHFASSWRRRRRGRPQLKAGSSMHGRALIAGGGIGGLAAAIALARQGMPCEILERSHFAEETGAGIQLGPNATRALRTLGVLDAIGRDAFRPDSIVIHDGVTGVKLAAMPVGNAAEERYGAPYLTMRLADLHAGLRAALASQRYAELRTGFELSTIEAQGGGGVVAYATDGSEAKGACLIGADGIWSALRPRISPGASLRFAG